MLGQLGRVRFCITRNFNVLPLLVTYRRTISNVYTTKHISQYSETLTKLLFQNQHISPVYLSRRKLSNFQSENDFHDISDETLDGLSDFFDSIADTYDLPKPDEYDVNFGDGVLTVTFGGDAGTYVINKQTPNQQIWLSSPSSGPKRYDFLNNTWIYKHDQVSLHELLSREVSIITGQSVDFTQLLHGGQTHTEQQ